MYWLIKMGVETLIVLAVATFYCIDEPEHIWLYDIILDSMLAEVLLKLEELKLLNSVPFSTRITRITCNRLLLDTLRTQ